MLPPEKATIVATHPSTHARAWEWILAVVLAEWFDLAVVFRQHHFQTIELSLSGKTLTLNCDFLAFSEADLPSTSHFPSLPLQDWLIPAALRSLGSTDPIQSIPILFGTPEFTISDSGSARLGLDVFGAAFFLLSRYEELALPSYDKHGRHLGSASFSSRAGILERPLVDEYVEILANAMTIVWPLVPIERQQGSVIISCDVDEPFERWVRNPVDLAKGIGGALLRHRSLQMAKRRLSNAAASFFGNYTYDPNWCFDWYMDVCERYNLCAEFYFLAEEGPRGVDAAYSITSPRIQKLLRQIHDRGHLIGLHGSYDSFDRADKLTQEREKLEGACRMAGAGQEVTHTRQHYLRWDATKTPDCQQQAGFMLDSTGGYADKSGFRFGTSRVFSMWSWSKRNALAIAQQPLIVMEGTLLSGVYSEKDAAPLETIVRIKRKSLTHGGNFSILWHNSSLTLPTDRALFEAVLE